MGRRIYDNTGNFVWKYSFGSQPSEMNRITHEFNVGKYITVEKEGWQTGKLKLNRNDLKDLRVLLQAYQNIINTVNKTTDEVYGENGLASFDKIRKAEADLQKKFPDESIYFWPMVLRITECGEEYFIDNPTKRVYTLDDEY